MLKIQLDDLSSAQVAQLHWQHLDNMLRISPSDSVHALDLNKLKAPNINFWCAWLNAELLGCVALKILSPTLGEIKSMRTPHNARRKGITKQILEHIIKQAKALNLNQLMLETGTQTFFHPAHQLYLQRGFQFCEPFSDYIASPNSRFMRLNLDSD